MTPTPDLAAVKEAAERYRKYCSGNNPYGTIGDGFLSNIEADVYSLADGYLALVARPVPEVVREIVREVAEEAAARQFEFDCTNSHPETDGELDAVMHAIADKHAARLAPHLVAHAADDGEGIDPDWLTGVGFSGGNDEPNVDVYDLRVNGSDLIIRTVLTWRHSEIVETSVSLYWSHQANNVEIGLYYGIDDNPTRGDVRRLAAALGIPLAETGKGGGA